MILLAMMLLADTWLVTEARAGWPAVVTVAVALMEVTVAAAAMEGVRRTAHTGLGRWRELPPARNLYVALA